MTSKRNNSIDMISRTSTLAIIVITKKDIPWYAEQFQGSLKNQLLVADELPPKSPTDVIHMS